MEQQDKKNLARAKEYIKAGLTKEAKEILFEMPQSSVARRWLRQLERREGEDESGQITTDFYGVPYPVLYFIMTNISIWLIALVVYLIQENEPIVDSMKMIATLAGIFAIVLIFQFFGGKAYWWMVAFGWLLVTVILLAGLVIGKIDMGVFAIW